MPNQKPKAKISLQDQLKAEARRLGLLAVQKLFGLSQGWEQSRNIVANNYELGVRHLAQGHFKDAILRFRIVTWFDPKHADGWYRLGAAYLAVGKRALAKKALSYALKLKPDNEEAIYMMAMAGGKTSPKRMPPTLALQHFDRLASGYTRSQMDVRHYQGHRLISNTIRGVLVPGRIDNVILELGIGTGLCGPLIRDVATQLIGIDQSAPMLAEAAKLQDANGKKTYDALIQRDVHEFLQGAAPEKYDIIMAAELFSYLGDVSDLFPLVAHALKPGGLFAFTADKMDKGYVRLDPAVGRFRFSKAYFDGLAAAQEFKVVTFDPMFTYPNYEAWVGVFRK